jgi:hypothetical protein
MEMPRELEIIIPHTEQHIIEAIKKSHPDWIEDDGVCKRCYEFYRNQMKK